MRSEMTLADFFNEGREGAIEYFKDNSSVTNGCKHDSGKPEMNLMLSFSNALLAVGEVATFGRKKYSKDGWLSVPNAKDRYTAALLRHLMSDSEVDEGSGLRHAAHTAWNALAILELKIREEERYGS